LTLHQAIQDFVHFSKTVDLPFDTNHSSNADKAPWVFSGGSYSGALTAWTESMAPGTFWAYHASSAPVEAIDNYVSFLKMGCICFTNLYKWQYFVPVQEGMAKNCSKDINLVIEYMDNVFTHGSETEQLALKKKFGLEYLTHADDVMGSVFRTQLNHQPPADYLTVLSKTVHGCGSQIASTLATLHFFSSVISLRSVFDDQN
jgi:hypothetical protein